MLKVDVMSQFQILKLPTHSDLRGSLSVLEGELPFVVVRTYWIYDADGQTRGGHRHRHTRQALVALSGQVSVYMNDGVASQDVLLDSPGSCLLVEPKDWHTMTFGRGAVLLVMSSHPYDRSEYIDEPYV
jgi:mannose-6-phosphate isomerase-like protein (cupin superfamily)